MWKRLLVLLAALACTSPTAPFEGPKALDTYELTSFHYSVQACDDPTQGYSVDHLAEGSYLILDLRPGQTFRARIDILIVWSDGDYYGLVGDVHGTYTYPPLVMVPQRGTWSNLFFIEQAYVAEGDDLVAEEHLECHRVGGTRVDYRIVLSPR